VLLATGQPLLFNARVVKGNISTTETRYVRDAINTCHFAQVAAITSPAMPAFVPMVSARLRSVYLVTAASPNAQIAPRLTYATVAFLAPSWLTTARHAAPALTSCKTAPPAHLQYYVQPAILLSESITQPHPIHASPAWRISPTVLLVLITHTALSVLTTPISGNRSDQELRFASLVMFPYKDAARAQVRLPASAVLTTSPSSITLIITAVSHAIII
jgi:hypothetical protein